MKDLIAAAVLTLGTLALPAAHASEPAHYNVGIYAANATVEQAWSCDSVMRNLETVMSEELEYEVELDLRVESSHQAGVMDMTDGSVQFGRFTNISSRWVLNHAITNEVAQAWLVALRTVDPEGTLDRSKARFDSGCGNDKMAALSN